MRNLRRSARRHAGVDPEFYYTFEVGQHVQTPEGFPGVVTAIEDGAAPGEEQYLVTLNDDMGGGEYAEEELIAILPGEEDAPHVQQWTSSLQAEAASEEWRNIPGLTFRVSRSKVTAFSPEADAKSMVAGKVSWYPSGEIWFVVVFPAYRRMGLATELLRRAREVNPNVHHSENLTEDGMAWSSATASRTAGLQAEAAIPLTCSGCGETYFTDGEKHGCEGAEGSLHDHWTEASVSHVASEDYPELSEILVERPPLAHSERVASLQREASQTDLGMPTVGLPAAEAGFWDRVLDPVAQNMLRVQEQSGYGTYNAETGAMASFDWCRFRHNRRCFFPKQLDEEGTKQAGYAVWVPEDRGFCPREKWDAQKACPAPSEPGPDSGDPKWLPKTNKSYRDGGQRFSSREAVHTHRDVKEMAQPAPTPEPTPIQTPEPPRRNDLAEDLAEIVDEHRQRKSNPYDGGNPYTSSLVDGEFTFHVTARWKDVQAKAKRIRSSGKVRVISASTAYLVGEVQGDNAVYQATLMREPGTTKVALWECGCAWAAYSWGRSGRWKKYEGRLCSHALALNYEGMSRGWLDGKNIEDRETPAWRKDQPVTVPGDYDKGDYGKWRVGSLHEGTLHYARVNGGFDSYEDAAMYLADEAARFESRVTPVLRRKALEFNGEMQGLDYRFKTFESLVRKLKGKNIPPSQITEPFRVIKDALRYTIALPEPGWGEAVQNILWEIQDAGFVIKEEENTWARGDSYSGLHYQLQPRGADLVFELQFHTSKSYTLKEKVLHRMYEEFRNPSTLLSRRQYLFDEMAKFWDNIPIPDNAMEFPDQKFYSRPTASLGAEETIRTVSTSADLAEVPAHEMVRDMLADGDSESEVIATLASLGVSDPEGLFSEAMAARPFTVMVNGRIGDVIDLGDGEVEVRGVGKVPAERALYPTYHPTRGLNYSGSKTAAKPLPEGYTLQFQRGGNISNHMVVAVFEDQVAGAIQWKGAREVWGGQRQPDGSMESVLIKRPPQIVDLKVYPEHRRKGLATAMYEEAKRIEPDLVHDDIVLPDGEAWMKSLSATAAADHDGYMVAFTPPPHVIEAIHADIDALWGADAEHPTQYHVTLVYPGDSDAIDPIAFEVAARDWASRWGTFTAKVSGYGVFHQDGGEKVLYASIDAPGAGAMRQDLVDTMRRFGIDPPENHGWTPHMTLVYEGEANTPTPPQELPEEALGEWTVSDVAIVIGQDWKRVSLERSQRIDIGGGRDNAWGYLPWGQYEGDVVWAGPNYDAGDHAPLQGSPEAAASFVATASVSQSDLATIERIRQEIVAAGELNSQGGPSCGVTSEEVAVALGGAEVYGAYRLPSGRTPEHAWVQMPDGTIIDATGDQFGMPPIQVIPPGDPRAANYLDQAGDDDDYTAALHDPDEAALPSTTAEDDEDAVEDFVGDQTDLAKAGSVEEIVSAFQRSAGARAVQTSGSPAQARGGDDVDIAAAANAHLAKTALKAFSPAEQKQIIEEGSLEGVQAANLDRLDITGTHYEALQSALDEAASAGDDDSWLL